MDDLPSNFDVVVTGTGLTQAIIAAACARIGKSVFNCDANDSYGQEWQAMNWESMQNWLSRIHNQTTHNDVVMSGQQFVQSENLPEINENECIIRCERSNLIRNVWTISYLCEENEVINSSQEVSNEISNQQAGAAAAEIGATEAAASDPIQWTPAKFITESRKFSLDLCPKLLFSHGSMVDLLVTSNISRYAEFKAVTRILTSIEDKLIDVPCSRNDIFNCKDVSVVEKRMLMKFMQFCHEYEKFPEVYKDYENLPIIEFLQTQKLSPILEQFILNAIAMVNDDCPTIEALKAIKKFINCCGRFGNTPFLFTLYGSGEMPQAFCRLCAVFGGVYCLKKKFHSIITDSQTNQLKGVVIDGKRINCQYLVTDYSLIDSEQQNNREEKLISRAILLSDSSIKPVDSEQITFFRIPKTDDNKQPVFVIETGHASLVTPKGLYVVYLWCDSMCDNAKHDLLPIVKKLYNFNPAETESEKPKLLWSLYFNQVVQKVKSLDSIPSNVQIATGPINEIDYDFAIEEAREIFNRMYPGQEFLPRAPDPNEIVFDPPQNNDIEMNDHDAPHQHHQQNHPPNENNGVPFVDNENNDIHQLIH